MIDIDNLIDYYLIETLAEISAEDYLESIVSIYHPQFITTGYNYTFGKNKKGTSKTLEDNNKRSYAGKTFSS